MGRGRHAGQAGNHGQPGGDATLGVVFDPDAQTPHLPQVAAGTSWAAMAAGRAEAR